MTGFSSKTGGPGQPAAANPSSPARDGVVVSPSPGQEAGTRNPFPYVVAFVIGVLAIAGIMMSRQETKPMPVQAHAPSAVVSLSPALQEEVTAVEVQQVERPEVIVVESPHPQPQTIVVETTPAAVVVQQPASAGNTASVPRAAASQPSDGRPKQIEVADLDYSAQLFQPMSEQELDAAITQLDADIDATEDGAEAKSQGAGLEILEERFDVLEDRRKEMTGQLSQDARLALTRGVEELRAELTAFQKDLAAL